MLDRAAAWHEESNKLLSDSDFRSLLQEHFQGVDTDVEKVRSMVDWYQKVRAEYGIGFGRRVPLAQALFSLPSEFLRGINTLNNDGLRQQIDSFNQALRRLALVYTKMAVFTADDVDFASDNKPLETAKVEIEKKLISCQRFLVDANMSQALLWEKVTSVKQLDARLKSFLHQGLDEKYFGNDALLSIPVSGHVSPELSRITATMDFVRKLYKQCSSPDIISLVKQCSNIESIAELRQVGSALEALMRRTQYEESVFFELVGGNREQWFEYSGFDIKHVIERNERAVESGEWLDSWIKYLFAKARMEKGGYSRLNQYLSQSSCSREQAQRALKFATYQMLAREIYRERPELTQMSGHEQAAIQQQFAKYDEELKILQRKRVAALASERHIPSGTRGAKVASYTEDALLDHEIKKKTRHISIRNLVSRAGPTLVGYKPCFMMSPMAVAKYIPPGSITFDIVVMDEASQVKPQDALSCFARGKQIVVVGDSKQLPPTSFFEKTVSNNAEDDQEDVGVIDDAESILDAVSDHFQKRQLKWHYRSRHESLIAFSNHRFYENSLVVFPSPWGQSDEFGIKFNHVPEGQFLNSVNHGESHAVVAAIREHLLSKTSESLGVVAMNSKQRDYIEADLELLIGKDKLLREAYESNQRSDDPLFIKNLENVQGDERDVIFISFTYGPQEKGAANIPQRFGPINSASGWRRLNVLFTRAKKRIQIYSSMIADQIVSNENSSLGVTSLKGYLKYAQHGQLIGYDGVQQKEPDSDFEISVMDALARKGFECVPQVGVSGFFIDIAVRDPGMPGRYLMGIECDGATYHSSKSTRDRDRVRQGVLEGLGWNIRRIWSTDWFKHPEAELKPIFEELKRLSTPMKEQTYAESAFEANKKLTEGLSHKAAETLEIALNRYKLVIEKKYPDTEPHERLLRPDMIEHLIMDRPMTHEEFTLRIPAYLRQNTSVKEAADYLDDVLEIITDYESIESFSLTSPGQYS
ncbi:AAA domain-containing protein [Vibrio hyugaensis]|uniref:AAA domain-containing protein n=1 Tax=Vibrio hyugaensis TaxID=1534743 RepID=UPI001FCA2AD7|nr:AAA domain-containing protein [Vibrio hyugaensis]